MTIQYNIKLLEVQDVYQMLILALANLQDNSLDGMFSFPTHYIIYQTNKILLVYKNQPVPAFLVHHTYCYSKMGLPTSLSTYGRESRFTP